MSYPHAQGPLNFSMLHMDRMGGPDAAEAIDETTWHITMNCGQSAIHSSDIVQISSTKAV